jgi:hypothetical protein
MKREQEILKAYNEQQTKLGNQEHTFMRGAKWADANPHWISVEDELPKKDGDILVYCADGVGVWEYDKSYNGQDMKDYNHITHWMPMPQAPTCSEKPNNSKKGGKK